MNNRGIKHNHWFAFSIILVILSLMWFLIDIKNTKSSQIISQEEKLVAKPLTDELLIDQLGYLQNKLVISDSDLDKTQPYAVSAYHNETVNP